jgi:hypothetical protein
MGYTISNNDDATGNIGTAGQIEKRIIKGLAACLSGFAIVESRLLERRRDDGVVWQLRCGGRHDASTKKILLTISAGLHFEKLEAILQREQEAHAPTLSAPTHLLHADHNFFEWDTTAPDLIEKLIEEIQKYAPPFFEYYEKLENSLTALIQTEPRKWPPVSNRERVRLVIALLITQGKHAEALTRIDREIDALQGKPPGHRKDLERLRVRLQ